MNYKKKQALAAIVAPLVAISFFSGIVFANDSRASSVQSPLEASVENYSAKDPVQMGPGIAVAVTDAGSVQGFIHRGIYTYRGIPYAQAERFQAPREVKPWTGIRMAVTYGDIAPQDTSKEADIFPPALVCSALGSQKYGAGRRLPESQYLDTRYCRREETPCDGLVPWRRLGNGLGKCRRCI